jgi:hypothetical protein
MTIAENRVGTAGVDTHSDVHVVAALDFEIPKRASLFRTARDLVRETLLAGCSPSMF